MAPAVLETWWKRVREKTKDEKNDKIKKVIFKNLHKTENSDLKKNINNQFPIGKSRMSTVLCFTCHEWV